MFINVIKIVNLMPLWDSHFFYTKACKANLRFVISVYLLEYGAFDACLLCKTDVVSVSVLVD